MNFSAAWFASHQATNQSPPFPFSTTNARQDTQIDTSGCSSIEDGERSSTTAENSSITAITSPNEHTATQASLDSLLGEKLAKKLTGALQDGGLDDYEYGIMQGAKAHFGHKTQMKGGMPQYKDPVLKNEFDYPGWGKVSRVLVLEELGSDNPHRGQLGLFRATSIAGNDLIASVLYTIGVTTVHAGPLAPISLLLVCLFLWPFRWIYSEVGTALPLNGGTYNCLLNATSKFTATVAATLSLISYVATAVVSAASATSYVSGELGDFDTFWVTIGVLGLFALLYLLGIKDSANVAAAIFFTHGATLILLCVACFVGLIGNGGSVLSDNFSKYTPSNPAEAIYYGFCSGLLGITGFETASNYIEEQKPGVFPRVMNLMWWLVTLYNPTVGFLSLCVLPVPDMQASPANVLSLVGGAAGGNWLRKLIAIDAGVVLCGGVLTAYVGVTGLIERLASDRCLPRILVRKNKWTHTPHFIILGFFVLTSTLYALSGGDVTVLGGVFAVAFLSVMCMFAVGNMILKYKRPRLPRVVEAPWAAVVVGFGAMLSGLIGNIILDTSVIAYFLLYFIFVMAIITVTFKMILLTKVALYVSQRISFLTKRLSPFLIRRIKTMKQHTVVFFTKTDEIHLLNKAVKYAHENELCDRIKLVHVFNDEDAVPDHILENHYILDHVYPKIQIDLVLVQGEFCPTLVKAISKQFNIPLSFMFISCPGPHFKYNIGDFGGVRTIMQ